MNIGTNEICCGCGACEQICSKHAITMQANEEGFFYPVVNEDLCVDCGLCTKVCPELHTEESLNDTGKPLAVQANDNAILEQSSSGGVFSVIANHVLDKGGLVVGAALSDEMVVRHIAVDRKQDLYKLQGSKYAQSDTSAIYQQVQAKLKEGKFVFFTGTPCQVSALKLFLRKPYGNLLTADLVCHGTPSPLMFKELTGYLEKKYGGKLVHYQFRSKKMTGWSRVSACTMLIDGKVKNIYYDELMRAFFQAFLDGHVLRMDCYRCPFSKPRRTGDFTMADFWSLKDTNPKFPRQHRGVSMILVNTTKGEVILRECSNELYSETSDMDIILSGRNYQLIKPTELPPERKDIFNVMLNHTGEFINTYLRPNPTVDKKRFYKTAFKEQIKKMFRYNGQY